MRTGNILFSAVHLFVVFLIVGMGAFFVGIPYSPRFQFSSIHLILNEPSFFIIFGSALLLFGLFLFIAFYALNRKRYVQISLPYCKTLVDETIVKEYVQDYWKETFPSLETKLDVIIHPSQKIEVLTEALPNLEENKREDLFKRIQSELGVLLARRLGYEKDFLLTIVES